MNKAHYFMDSPRELKRLRLKFDADQALQQLHDMGYRKGMRFLDVGCGPGRMCELVSSIDRKNAHVNGVDANEKFVSYAREQAARAKSKARFHVGNAYQLPFDSNTFDFVWSRFFIEYLSKPLEAIGEMKRVLKPGGILALGDLDGMCLFNYPIAPRLEAQLLQIMDALKPTGFDPYVGRKLFHYAQTAKLRRLAVKIYPYHNIYGRPLKRDKDNWIVKISSGVDYTAKCRNLPAAEAAQLKKDFVDYIMSPTTFTYSVLIFVRGYK